MQHDLKVYGTMPTAKDRDWSNFNLQSRRKSESWTLSARGQTAGRPAPAPLGPKHRCILNKGNNKRNSTYTLTQTRTHLVPQRGEASELGQRVGSLIRQRQNDRAQLDHQPAPNSNNKNKSHDNPVWKRFLGSFFIELFSFLMEGC